MRQKVARAAARWYDWEMEKEKKMFLGVTGGIAAYKMPDFVRLLTKEGVDVHVVMTKNAEQFVTPAVLRTVSGNRVLTADWSHQDDPFDHLNISKEMDAALIAPATANFIAKMAHGIADDLLSTAVLALACPLYVAPAMNPRMLQNPAVMENLRILESRGIRIIPPESGAMACGEEGEGRLPALEQLRDILLATRARKQDFIGKRVIVTAGPTEEPIDPVRCLTNRSSGKMGTAIARAAATRGAQVTLIHGPVAIPLPAGMETVAVRTAREMLDALESRFEACDMLVMAAAVSDYRVASPIAKKMKKTDAPPTLALVQNPDLLEMFGKKKGRRVLVGFAAETEDMAHNAREKMRRKNLDLICANDVSRSDIGFGGAYNELVIIPRGQEPLHTGRLTKEALADIVLDEALKAGAAAFAASGGMK